MVSFLKRFAAVLLSTLFFTILTSIFFIITSYEDFFFLYIFGFFLYGGFAILLIGIPASYLIDFILSCFSFSNNAVRNSIKILLYVMGGFIGTFIFAAIMRWKNDNLISIFIDFLVFTPFGILASLLFSGCFYLVNILVEKQR